MGATEKLARFVVEFSFNDLPAKGIEQAKISLLDTIGAALVGAAGHTGDIVSDFIKEMGGHPQARLIGRGIKTSVADAALANGTFAHAEDYDDQGAFGHAGVVLTPTALALGEYLRLPGKKLLEAYAVGFEVGHKLNRNMGEVQVRGGYHNTSLFGTLAAAAESAKLLSLDVSQTRAALGIAASMASGIMQNFGTQTKPLHAGHASRCGITAAILAKKGFTGDPDILEAARGFVYVFGQEQADIKRISENIGKPLVIAEQGVRIKAFPCGWGNHPALLAILRLIEKHDIKPEQVNAIEVTTASKPPGFLIRTRPQNGGEGQHSMQYSMAIALADRKVDLKSYSQEMFSRPVVHDLMKKVKVTQHPELAGLPVRLRGEVGFATVTLRLKDGRVLSERQEYGAVKGLSGEAINTKYIENAKIGGLSPSKIERSLQLLKGLENLEDTTQLMDAIS
jgi:2-methylcitrate dehydratase PrpD